VTPALQAALAGLGLHATDGVTPHAPTLDLVVPDEDLLPLIAERTLASGARLYALTPRRASLEQVFLEIVGAEDSGQ
jgi:ABC-2 type transport system ATP-binding protein